MSTSLVCLRLFDDQLLGVDRLHANVVADDDYYVMRGHGAAVRIGQRGLVRAGSVDLGQHRGNGALKLSAAIYSARFFVRAPPPVAPSSTIALGEPLEVVFEPLVTARCARDARTTCAPFLASKTRPCSIAWPSA